MEAQELRWLARLLSWALLLLATPVAAQTADPALTARATELVAVLAGQTPPDYFAPVFSAAVSPAQLAPLLAQLRATLGLPERIEATAPDSPFAARLTVGFERGTATVRIAIDPAAPHQVIGLLITGTALRDDSVAKLIADVQALPGHSGLGIYELGYGEPRPVAQWRGEATAPLGSAFKLWLLAEASRQVSAGQRRWADVIPLGAPSLPSGITQNWPPGTPLTLQSLATLTVSISDNTAADTLLLALGRDRVGRFVTAIRAGDDPGRTLPILTTREAFAIKADPALAAAWAHGDLTARRALLAANAERIRRAPLSTTAFANGPVSSETVEWFASPADMARTLDWLRVHGDATARAILAVNAGTDPATVARFGYVGFKGGSEPGVVTLNYLVRTRHGRLFAITGNWHRPDADTPLIRFATLMNRALALTAALGG